MLDTCCLWITYHPSHLLTGFWRNSFSPICVYPVRMGIRPKMTQLDAPPYLFKSGSSATWPFSKFHLCFSHPLSAPVSCSSIPRATGCHQVCGPSVGVCSFSFTMPPLSLGWGAHLDPACRPMAVAPWHPAD